jgi:toxin ParE1/3/4
MKPVRWRPAAESDVLSGAKWYAKRGGAALANRFIDEVEATIQRLSEHPLVGSTRHADVLPDLDGVLRFFRLQVFQRYLIYFIDHDDHVEVIRVWNASRGLQALMDSDD